MDLDPQTISETLASREVAHGNFAVNTVIMQGLKFRCRNSPNWNYLSDPQRESIEMICHKLGRILCGNPNEPDHWHDIAGYATLIENILSKSSSN